MNEKILKTLEYDKIQQALLGQVVTANGRQLVQAHAAADRSSRRTTGTR